MEELTRALIDCHPDSEYWYFSDQRLSPPPPGVQLCAPPESLIQKRWWLLGAARQVARFDIQLFHGTDFAVPYLPRCASVMTLHDLSPWRDRSPDSSRVRTRAKALLRLRVPTMVITPSDAVRREAINFFGWPESRMVTVPLAPAPWLTATPPLETPGERDDSDTPYFLYVGALEDRKNVHAIVEAWQSLPVGSVKLVLVGRARPGFQLPAPAAGMEIRQAVEDPELASLYSNAVAVLYLSSYEGFGLPVLEAMQCGAPVIASNDPAVQETAGNAAWIVDPLEIRSVAEAMRGILRNPERAHELSGRGKKHAAGFNWPRTANLTFNVYKEALTRYKAGTWNVR